MQYAGKRGIRMSEVRVVHHTTFWNAISWRIKTKTFPHKPASKLAECPYVNRNGVDPVVYSKTRIQGKRVLAPSDFISYTQLFSIGIEICVDSHYWDQKK